MTNRFDNLSIEMMQDEVRRLHQEQKAMVDALIERLRAECNIEIGKVYRIRDNGEKWEFRNKYAGRIIKVTAIQPQFDRFYPCKGVYVLVHGRLNLKKSISGDGWGLRHVVVDPKRLEPHK